MTIKDVPNSLRCRNRPTALRLSASKEGYLHSYVKPRCLMREDDERKETLGPKYPVLPITPITYDIVNYRYNRHNEAPTSLPLFCRILRSSVSFFYMPFLHPASAAFIPHLLPSPRICCLRPARPAAGTTASSY